MHREELLQWVKELGNEFVRRGMHGHAQKLRVYFLALEKHLLPRNLDLEVHWTKNMVLDWMKTLRLAPFENALSVRLAGKGCGRCQRGTGAQPSARTECVFPGGARMRCDDCGAVWLEEDALDVSRGRSPAATGRPS